MAKIAGENERTNKKKAFTHRNGTIDVTISAGRCERIANAFENEASGQMLEYHNTFEALRISHMQSKQPINNKYRVGTHTHTSTSFQGWLWDIDT